MYSGVGNETHHPVVHVHHASTFKSFQQKMFNAIKSEMRLPATKQLTRRILTGNVINPKKKSIQNNLDHSFVELLWSPFIYYTCLCILYKFSRQNNKSMFSERFASNFLTDTHTHISSSFMMHSHRHSMACSSNSHFRTYYSINSIHQQRSTSTHILTFTWHRLHILLLYNILVSYQCRPAAFKYILYTL